MRLLFSILFLLASGLLKSQDSYQYTLIQVDCRENCTEKLNSSLNQLKKNLEYFKLQKHSEGFIEFSFLPEEFTTDSLKIGYHLGEQYVQSKVRIVLAELDSIREIKLLNPKQSKKFNINLEIKQLLDDFENNGYPFASLSTESSIERGQVESLVTIRRGPLIVYDEIKLNTDSLINLSYLQNLLEIKPGEPYSEQDIAAISRKLQNDRLVKLKSSPKVIFSENKAKLFLELVDLKSSTFNGIVGVLPSTNSKTVITGELNLNLVNGFRRGEKFQINWQRLKPESQNLDLSADLPYLFKSKLGVGGALTVFRQDSSVNRSVSSVSLNYAISPNFKVFAGFERTQNNSQLTSNDAYSNTKVNSYFTGMEFSNLDYVLNPRSGTDLRATVSGGTRTAGEAENNVVKSTINAQLFVPLLSKTTLRFSARGSTITSDSLYLNEVYYIGGISSVRGVNERTIPSTSQITGTMEFRYLFERSSNILLFFENNWNELNINTSYSNMTISSAGIGLNIGTKSGIFSLNYALSNQEEGKFLLRNAKINFGFSNTF